MTQISHPLLSPKPVVAAIWRIYGVPPQNNRDAHEAFQEVKRAITKQIKRSKK